MLFRSFDILFYKTEYTDDSFKIITVYFTFVERLFFDLFDYVYINEFGFLVYADGYCYGHRFRADYHRK